MNCTAPHTFWDTRHTHARASVQVHNALGFCYFMMNQVGAWIHCSMDGTTYCNAHAPSKHGKAPMMPMQLCTDTRHVMHVHEACRYTGMCAQALCVVTHTCLALEKAYTTLIRPCIAPRMHCGHGSCHACRRAVLPYVLAHTVVCVPLCMTHGVYVPVCARRVSRQCQSTSVQWSFSQAT